MSHSSGPFAGRLARMRGRLPAEEPGARGIEQWGRNPHCQRLSALTLTGISPATALREVYREQVHEGQSPFAIAVGTTFERELLTQNAARLLDLYRTAGRLSLREARIVLIDEIVPLGGRAAMDRRRALTRKYLALKLQGDPRAPNIIVHGRLSVKLLGIDHDIEPDALVAANSDLFYRPVEIKSYPDREGKTDPADLRGALRQAAVALNGLRQHLRHVGVADPESLAPAVADLVLKVPGSSRATLHPMTIEQECASIEGIFVRAQQEFSALEALLSGLSQGATLDDPGILDHIPNALQPGCREFCPLAAHCKRQALQTSETILLGPRAREALAPAGSLIRTLDLLNGTGGPVRSEDERALAERLREDELAWRKAVS
jgi:hypothetical protein